MTRIEALELCKLEHARYNHLRELQWKMDLSIWSLISLGILNAKLFNNLPACLIIIVSLTIILAHVIFIYRSQWSLKASRKFENLIEERLGRGTEDPLEISRPDYSSICIDGRGWGWFFSQILPTIALGAIFIISTC